MGNKEIISVIVTYLRSNNVNEIGFFGSFVRNEMNPDSDVDVLVDYKRGTTLFDISRMKIELDNLIGRKVDLVDKKTVKPALMKYIERDLTTVYHV